MKVRLIILVLTSLILLSVVRGKVSICECQNTFGYYAYKNCNMCPKDCSKSICIRNRYVSAANHNILKIPILQCQTSRGSLKDNWYSMDPPVVCDKPNIFFGCFNEITSPYDPKPILYSTTCRLTYNYKLECSQFYNEISCKPNTEVSQKFDIKTSFNIYKPVTFDHFDLSGQMSDFWGDKLKDQFEGFQTLEEIQTNKDNIEIQLIKTLAMHAFHTKTPEEPTALENLEVLRNEEENIYIEVGYDRSINSLIIAFRGTHFTDQADNIDLNNILNDLKVIQKPSDNICAGCAIHTGFFNSFESIKENLRKLIYKKREKYFGGLYFIGHSYGGALATLAAANFMNVPNFQSCLVTFGAPRVGNQMFASFINSNLFGKNFRVTYIKDPIVSVPSHPNYLHAGTEIHFSSPLEFVKNGKEQDLNGNDYSLLDIGDHSDYRLIYLSTNNLLFIYS